jgi:gliding motility-associated-like protein
MKKLILLLAIFTGLAWLNTAQASHMAGGDIQYRYIGDSSGVANQYRIIVRLYRDVAGIGMPTSIPVYVCSSCYPTQTVTLPLTGGGPGSVAPTLFDCVDPTAPGTVTMEIYIYKGVVVLPGLCSDWKFAYNTCCRNFAVDNIVNAGSQAFYIEAKLNNFLGNNTSPFFVSEPVRAFCVGQLFNWKQSAIEPDNDSINYTIVAVRGNTSSCTFNNLAYSAGFTPQQPISTTPPQSMVINPSSGVITFKPSTVEIDVLAVVVEEYRFDSTYFQWVKIGESNRDMQITISPNCSQLAQQGVLLDTLAPGTYPDPITGLPTVDYTCLDSSVTLNFMVKLDCSTISPDGTDFRLTAPDGQPIPVKSITAMCDNNNETQQLTLKLHKPLAFNGYYFLYSKMGNDGNTLLNKCGFPMAEFDTIQLRVQGCFTTQMDIKNVTIVEDEHPRVQWLLDTIGSALAPFPKYLVDQYKIYRQDPGQPNYFLLYTINDYKNMQFDDKSLSWPDVDANKYSYKVEVVVNSTPAVLTRGVHSILLKSVVSPIGLPDTVDLFWNSYNGWPAASYTVELGTEASGVYNWADHSHPISPANPTNDTTYLMRNEGLDPGKYAIRIRADYPGGAGPYVSYSNWLKFEVYEPPVIPPPGSDSIRVPNVITPNNDGTNDLFTIENIMSWPTTRSVRIFNRWGHIVYENEMYDNSTPWDGTDKSGSKLADGTYFYSIEVVNQPVNKREVHTGTVTLMGGN